MEAKLYGQNKGGMSINGIIKDYYAYAGEEIKAGDLVEYINGVAGKVDYGESVDTQLSTETYTGYTISAVALDDNRVFIAHSYGSSYHLYALVVTVNGENITYGADTEISTSGYTGYRIATLLLPNGNVFIAHSKGNSSTNYLKGRICEISGEIITVGSEYGIASHEYSGLAFSACLLPNGNVFIAHRDTSNHLYGIVVTIDGTTIAEGDNTKLVAKSNAGYEISTCLLPNGNVFIAHSYGSDYYLYGIVCSISGTTITAGSDTSISTTEEHSGSTISTCLLPNGNIFIAHSRDSGAYSKYLYGIVVSVDGTTISTVSGDKALVSEQATGSNISTVVLADNKVLILHTKLIGNTGYYLFGMIISIDNRTITTGIDVQMNNAGWSGSKISSFSLNNGTIFIAHSHTNKIYYLYAQIWAIDYENNIPTNNIVTTEYETQIRQVTTGQFDGIAKTSGTGGDDTGHKDIVEIWTKVKEETPEGTQQVTMADGNTLTDANGDIFLVREEIA